LPARANHHHQPFITTVRIMNPLVARFRCIAIGLFVACPALLTVPRVQAESALDEGVQKLCAKITEFMREENQKSIMVGDFIAPPKLKASGGPGISQMISTAFQKQDVTLGEGGFQLLGRFELKNEEAHDDGFASVVLRIRAEVLDKNDDPLKAFSISVFGDAALQLAGGNVDLSEHPFPEDREKTKRDSFDSPQAAVIGNETRATEASLFGIEVHVRSGDQLVPRAPSVSGGRSFVKLVRGDEYVVRLMNHAPFETAVTLTIDGLSMFTFTEEDNQASQVLVPAGSFVDIPGWYCTSAQSKAFEITGYPESAAGQRGVTSGVGTITASFSAAWPKGGDPPDDEPRFARSAESDIATGLGRQIDQAYEKVERDIGQLRATVSVRYNR
jgi:hypothetical protein